MTDEWRRWIAENLMLGASRESIHEMMVQAGLAPSESAGEIDLALQSPYLKGAERLRNRLTKREWLLGAYRKLNRLRAGSGEIERRHRLSQGEFVDRYYSASRAVIITGMMDDWPALGKWSLEYFSREFGSREVEVQVGRNASDNYEAGRDQFRKTMIFSEFIERVSNAGSSNDIYITASNNSGNNVARPGRNDHPVPPRSDQQLHGTGHGSEANSAGAVVGDSAHEEPLSCLLRGGRPHDTAGSPSRLFRAAGPRVHP
jgi:hypothetical protein